MGLNRIINLQMARMDIYNDDFEAKDIGVFDNFERNPSYRQVDYKDETIGVHIIEDGIRSDIVYRKVISRPPIQLSIGDYISCNDNIWLCINEEDLLYNKTLFAQCNKTLKWINKNDILIEKPAITTSQTLYTTGMKEEKLIQVPDGMTGILFPYDDDTKELNRGDMFVFNKTKYIISHYNEADRPGIISFICSEIGINYSTDDLENEVANRWDKITKRDRLGQDEDPPEPPYEDDEVIYTITGNDKIRESQISTYTIVKTLNNQILEGSYEFIISNQHLAEITDIANNHCIIKANKVGTFDLVIHDTDTDIETIKTIEIIPFL